MKNIPIPWFLCHHTWLSSQCTVAWIQYPGSSDVLSTTTRPLEKEQFYSHQSTECYAISLWPNQCVPWQIVTDSAHAVFFNNGALEGLLADSLALIKHLLTVTALTGHFRSSLIFLEVMIGWIFTILTILQSVLTEVACFLLRVSGFCWHFKAFEIILAEDPILCCTFL